MSAPGDSTPCMLDDSEASPEPEPSGGLTVAIVKEQGDWSGFDSLEQAIDAAALALTRHPQAVRARGAEAGVVLADDGMVRGLNATYRGKDAPTNVLSFPFQAPAVAVRSDDTEREAVEPAEPRHLGDVVLAAETVGREADAQGIPPLHHLQHLVVHGLLHLLGFDHDTEPQAETMEGLEVEILATLGVPDPYAAAEGR